MANIYHAFAIQSFTDELAHAAGKDPLEYTLALWGRTASCRKRIAEGLHELRRRLRAISDRYGAVQAGAQLAAEKAGWGKKKTGNGFGMGIAVHRSFLTYAATVVQVHVDDAGKVQIERVDSALDAGTVVNPEMARNKLRVRR